MTCQQVQSNLSLYLYGELDFSSEDQLEEHLDGCAFCQLALSREKNWHASLNAEQTSVPLELLSSCRRGLQSEIAKAAILPNELGPSRLVQWFDRFTFSSPVWMTRVAAASLLLMTGFGAGRWVNQPNFPPRSFANPIQAGMFAPYTRVRQIEPIPTGGVRLVIDEGQERELRGSVADSPVRQLLLTATQDSMNPAIRVDSVQLLSSQSGNDVRDALLSSVRMDRNAAVRLKALEGLRAFANDPVARHTLIDVLRDDDNPGIRSEAIDMLVPTTQTRNVTPDLADTLQQIAGSDSSNEYVRMRCLQILRAPGNSPEVY